MSIIISGLGKVLIRTGSSFTFQKIHYEKNQLVAAVQNAKINFEYSVITKNNTQGVKTQGSNTKTALTRITIENFPMNKIMSNLVFSTEKPNTVWVPHAMSTVTDTEGRVALPIGEWQEIQELQICNKDYSPIEYTYDSSKRIIETKVPLEDVIVSYELANGTGVTMKTENNSLPYFKLECISDGSYFDIVNGGSVQKPTSQIIKIERASLDLQPYFYFQNNHTPLDLSFNVIHDVNNLTQYIWGE